MMSPIQTFAAMDGNAVFGLIAMAIWIWLSIAGKRSKAERKTQPPPLVPIPGEPQSPQDELRKFFAELEKGPTPPTAAVPDAEAMPPPRTPPPMPKPVRVIRPVPHHAAPPHAPARATPPAPVVRAPVDAPPLAALPPLAQLPELRIMGSTATRVGQPSATPAPGRPRLELLRTREGLQSAIVAAEVLGVPLGLRQGDRLGRPAA